MRILNEQEKRDALNEVLIELSKSQDILKEARDRVSFLCGLKIYTIIIIGTKNFGTIILISFQH